MKNKLSIVLKLLILLPIIQTAQSEEIKQVLVLLDYFCGNFPQESINLVLLDQDEQDLDMELLFGGGIFKSCSNRPVAGVNGMDGADKFLSGDSVTSVNVFFRGAGESLSKRNSTKFNWGVWILPEFFLSTSQTEGLRLDSQVFTYQKVENNTEGEKAYVIKEIYSIKATITKTNIIGTWDLGEEATMSLPILETIWERRANLSGVDIVGMSLTSLPFTKIEADDRGNVKSASGVFFDIIGMLQEIMEFNIQMNMPWDRKWGSQFVNLYDFKLSFFKG